VRDSWTDWRILLRCAIELWAVLIQNKSFKQTDDPDPDSRFMAAQYHTTADELVVTEAQTQAYREEDISAVTGESNEQSGSIE